MPFFDFPLEKLETYKPPSPEQPDFDDFWQRTLTDARQHPLDFKTEPVDFGFDTVETYDAAFSGYDGQRIKGWFMLPKDRPHPLPTVVEYVGYGGGRGFPHNWLKWVSAGFAYLVMDTRGQGSVSTSGDTPDLFDRANPFHPGFTTQGILDPETYYYRRLYTDAVRAVEACASHDAVDADRIAITGVSQGGGITVAVSGLAPELIQVAIADVPFMCDIQRAITLVQGVYDEIRKYLSVHREAEEQALKTLSYFDGISMARRSRARAYYSTGLMDDICPPSGVYAAFNHIPDAVDKTMNLYKYNGHNAGGDYHSMKKLKWLRELWREGA
jgi:cephalosporin-C deacetylase